MKTLHCNTLLMLYMFIFTGALYAQGTFFKLTTVADSTDPFYILNSESTTRMQVNSDGGLYVGGTFGVGVIPTMSKGSRLIWHPRKAAFRTGIADGAQWDDASIGNYSTAMGYNTTASSSYCTAMGYNTTASGSSSTAMGYSTTASGSWSTAMGFATQATANYSIAMGYGTTASGPYSTAMGYSTIASWNIATAMGYSTTAGGAASTAMGAYTNASGHYSTAIGYYTTASGNYSIAMGYHVSTNGYGGSCIIGDTSTTADAVSSTANQMTMRFAGGYRLYSNAALTQGVYMNAGVSGWSNVCDRNKKENFHPINGEELLTKISKMPITEWNYKGTDKSVKYIGPVAQDFYSAFHLGGTDSLGINTLCIDGVNMAAIQALEKRTAELQKANDKIELMEKRIEKLEQMISSSTKGQ